MLRMKYSMASLSRLTKLGVLALLYILIAGCAHPIELKPDVALISVGGEFEKIPATVGYYFLEDREKEVISAGGGGDKVRYKPYKDIELGLYKVLTNVFDGVHALDSMQDAKIDNNMINYVIALNVSTNSSSSSLFTWPPTDFGVNLSCEISDNEGAKITDILAIGAGHAEYSEFSSDFSLSARRASQDALGKLQIALLGAPELRVSSTGSTVNRNDLESDSVVESMPPDHQQLESVQTIEDKLIELKQHYDDGLISDEVYQEQQKSILSSQ